MTQRLCAEHLYLHGGKPALLSDPSRCWVCADLRAEKRGEEAAHYRTEPKEAT